MSDQMYSQETLADKRAAYQAALNHYNQVFFSLPLTEEQRDALRVANAYHNSRLLDLKLAENTLEKE